MTKHVEVFVIGAGPAGLTAAYCLSKQGAPVLVIEKDPVYVGGISRTVRYKDFLFDVGGHRFFSKSKEVVDLWREILPDGFIERPRLSRIFYGGKFYSYPLSAMEALNNLGLVTSAACMLSYAFAKLRPIQDARTFHQWVRNQFGEKLFSRPTPRRFGECRAMRFLPTGRHGGSRGSISALRSGTRLPVR
jgi:protoporphyrinogen oxidase